MASRLRELAAAPAARALRAVLSAAAPSVLSELEPSLARDGALSGEDLALARALDGASAGAGQVALALYDAHEEWAVGIEELEESGARAAVRRMIGLGALALHHCGGVEALGGSPAGRALLAWTGLVELALAFTSLGEIQAEHQAEALLEAWSEPEAEALGVSPPPFDALTHALEPFVSAGTGAVAEMADALRSVGGGAGPGVYELLVAALILEKRGPVEEDSSEGPLSFSEEPEAPASGVSSEPVGEDPSDFEDSAVDPALVALARARLDEARAGLDALRAALAEARAVALPAAPDRGALTAERAEREARLAALRASMPDLDALRMDLELAIASLPLESEVAGEDLVAPSGEALDAARAGRAEAAAALGVGEAQLLAAKEALARVEAARELARTLVDAKESLGALREDLRLALAAREALNAGSGASHDTTALREHLAALQAERAALVFPEVAELPPFEPTPEPEAPLPPVAEAEALAALHAEQESLRVALAEAQGRLAHAREAVDEGRLALLGEEKAGQRAALAAALELARGALAEAEATRAALCAERDTLRPSGERADTAPIAATLAALLQARAAIVLDEPDTGALDEALRREQAALDALQSLEASIVLPPAPPEPPVALRQERADAEARLAAAESARLAAEEALTLESTALAERVQRVQAALADARARAAALLQEREAAQGEEAALREEGAALAALRAALAARVPAAPPPVPPVDSSEWEAAEAALRSARAEEERQVEALEILEATVVELPPEPTVDTLLPTQLGWARDRLEEARRAAEETRQERDEAEQQMLAAAGERVRLEHLLEQARASLAAARAAREAVEDLGPAREDLAQRLRTARAEREAVRSVWEMTRAFVAESTEELDALRAELVEEPEPVGEPDEAPLPAPPDEGALQDAERAVTALRAERDQALARLERARAELAETRAEHEGAQAALDSAQAAVEAGRTALEAARATLAGLRAEREQLEEELSLVLEGRLALDERRAALSAPQAASAEPPTRAAMAELKLALGDALDEAGEAELRETAALAAVAGASETLEELERGLEATRAACEAMRLVRDGIRRDHGLAGRLIVERQREIRELWDDFAEREAEIVVEQKKSAEEAEFRAQAAAATREELLAAKAGLERAQAEREALALELDRVRTGMTELPRRSFSLLAARTAASTRATTTRQALERSRTELEALRAKVDAAAPAVESGPPPDLGPAAQAVTEAEQTLRSRRVELNRVRGALEGYRGSLAREEAAAAALRAEIERFEERRREELAASHRAAVERAAAAARLEAERLAQQDAGGWFDEEPSAPVRPPPKVILPSTPTVEDEVGGWWDEDEAVEDDPTEPPDVAPPPPPRASPPAPPKAPPPPPKAPPPLQPIQPPDSVGRAAPMTLQTASTTFMSVEDRKRLVERMMAEEDAEEDDLPPPGDDMKTTFFARPVRPKK